MTGRIGEFAWHPTQVDDGRDAGAINELLTCIHLRLRGDY
ncbi:hypothetical protein PLANPX_3851 [Lacipirellula parvula]|uniref:Uncharacterized protein n=1 Tax=Lacipirellula parvula TaxID=2650471 RepID=A0A5K7XMG9_9BACT|nr:hypothetical protein PLANPX_3851 [Lacipirellula parvula]